MIEKRVGQIRDCNFLVPEPVQASLTMIADRPEESHACQVDCTKMVPTDWNLTDISLSRRAGKNQEVFTGRRLRPAIPIRRHPPIIVEAALALSI